MTAPAPWAPCGVHRLVRRLGGTDWQCAVCPLVCSAATARAWAADGRAVLDHGEGGQR